MAGDVEAGSVWITFKTALQGVAAGFRKVQDGLANFEAGANRSFGRIAKWTSKILNVQFAMMQLTQAFGSDNSGLGRAIKAVSMGFSVFAMTAMIPGIGMFGLAAGAVLGLTTALVALTGESEAAAKRQEELAKRIGESNAALETARKNMRMEKSAFEEMLPLAQKLGIASELRGEYTRQQMEANEKRVVEFEEQLRQARENLQTASRIMSSSTERVSDRVWSWLGAEGGSTDFDKKHAAYIDAQSAVEQLQASLAKARAEASGLADELAKLEEGKKFDAATKARQKLFSQTLEGIKQETDQRIRSEREVLDELSAEDQILAYIKEKYEALAKIDPKASFSGLKEKFATLLELAKQKDFQRSFADPFARSITDGVREGIMSGLSALDTVRKIGENMFGASITKVCDDLKKGLSKALTEAFGKEGGGALGGLLSAVMGVVGFVLSGRGNKKGSQTYASISGITSSEATRGIVAGPSSVAIAAVGDNLARAFEPVVARLDISNRLLAAIQGNTSRSGGGLSYAGSVPT